MLRKMLKSKKGADREKELLTLQVSEAHEISEIILKRLDEKIKILKELDASSEEKIKALERLIRLAEVAVSSPREFDRQKTIAALLKKGLKIDEIAKILDMPEGEVELILSLSR